MYRKLFKEYKREGCSNEEARMYAKLDCKNSIGLDIDSAEQLYKDTLEDFSWHYEKVYYNTTQSEILLNHLCVHLRYVLSHQHIVNY